MDRTELLWRLFVRTGLPEAYTLYRRASLQQRGKKPEHPAGG